MQIVDLSSSGFSPMECPRCGKRTIVPHGDSLYICLNCGWRRDVSELSWNGLGEWLASLILISFILIVLIDLTKFWDQGRDSEAFLLHRHEETIPFSPRDTDESI